MARNDKAAAMPRAPAVVPVGYWPDFDKLQYEQRIAREVRAQIHEHRRKASRTPTNYTRARDSGKTMHHISVVKQEPGSSIPMKRKKLPEVIDLCDSDSDAPEDGTPPKSSATAPSCADRTTQTRSPDRDESTANSKKGNDADADAPQRLPVPGRSAPAAQGTQPKSTSEIVSELSTATLANHTSAAPGVSDTEAAAASRSYWKRRLDNTSQAGSSIAPTATVTATATDPPTPVSQPASASSSKHTSAKVKNSIARLKPEPQHPHKYLGPEITVLSLEAIFEHLDQAWGQGRATVTTIGNLSRWWKSSIVAFAHQLDKHQIWLLLFAETQWWKALEEQWNDFDALPVKDQSLILRMTEARLKKESRAATAEVALASERSIKNPDAVYLLGNKVKKEKMDGEKVEKRNKGSKRKRGELGRSDQGGKADKDKVDVGDGVKQVGLGAVKNVSKDGDTDKRGSTVQEADDGLSSDSDKEEE